MNLYNYLNESNIKINKKDVLNILQNECSDAWNFSNEYNFFIYKGIRKSKIKYDFFINKTPQIRKSAYTYNFYTPIINEHLLWSNFPKRNVICTTYSGKASQYGKVFYVFLYNGVKFGICPSHDIWSSFDFIQKSIYNDDLNSFFEQLIKDKIITNSKMNKVETLSQLKEVLNGSIEKLSYNYLHFYSYSRKFKLKTIYDFFVSIFNLINFSIGYYKDLKQYSNREVWFDGPALYIDSSLIENYIIYGSF